MQVVVVIQFFICNGGSDGPLSSSPHLHHHPRSPRSPRMGTDPRRQRRAAAAAVVSDEWSFRVCATIKPCVYNATETIGAVAFDSSNDFMATGGIARKIRVYKLDMILQGDEGLALQQEEELDEIQRCRDDDELGTQRRRWRGSTTLNRTLDTDRSSVAVICTPSRLSSLQWRPGARAESILCGDYDGVLTEWSIERQCPLVERYEHSGRHVWSVDFAKDESERSISASDDGTARVWESGMENSACKICAPRRKPVCCAEFDPCSGNLIALACADSNVYVHDLRMPELPLWTLAHHTRAASYARFLGEDQLVSASIDSTICLWDLGASAGASASSSPGASPRVVECFSGHHNVKNFVGLSVWGQGKLIACGSETNQAFVYQSGRDRFVLRHQFSYDSSSPPPPPNISRGFSSSRLVSAVSWMNEKPGSRGSCTLAAANSDGVLQILSGNSKYLN